MITGFKCKYTAELFCREFNRKLKLPNNLYQKAYDKLVVLNAAETLQDLINPSPSNHLEQLKGGRKNQFSIRVNIQYRICFKFENGRAYDVEIVDYH
jgi:proteic killer suppression protein